VGRGRRGRRRARPVARGPRRGRRAARAEAGRPPTGAGPGDLHGRPQAAGHAPRRRAALASRARAREEHRFQPCARVAGRARRDRAGRVPRAADGAALPRFARGRDCRRELRARPRGARARRRRVGGARAPARPRAGRPGEVVRRRAAQLRAWRRRRGLRRGRRGRRGRVPHTDRSAQRDGDAPVGRALGGRHARDLHLDPVHLGNPRLGQRAARPAARPRARGLQLHGRRLRREERPRRLHVHRDRARREDGPAGALRAHPPRGEPCHRQPQRHDPEAARRRALRRDARRARGRVREHDRLVRLLVRPASSRAPSGSSACSTSWPHGWSSTRSS